MGIYIRQWVSVKPLIPDLGYILVTELWKDVVTRLRRELGNRLLHERTRAGDSRGEAAQKLGVHLNTLLRYEQGDREPDEEFLLRFAETYGLDLKKLVAETANSWREPPPGTGDDVLISIPFWNAQVGAGAGRATPREPQAMGMTIARKWLSAWNVLPLSAALATASGDSMEPTIMDGDLLLIDTARNPVRDGIYIIRRDDDLQLKRLQLRSNGKIAIISDNPAWPEEIVTREELEQLYFEGRVRVVFKRV